MTSDFFKLKRQEGFRKQGHMADRTRDEDEFLNQQLEQISYHLPVGDLNYMHRLRNALDITVLAMEDFQESRSILNYSNDIKWGDNQDQLLVTIAREQLSVITGTFERIFYMPDVSFSSGYYTDDACKYRHFITKSIVHEYDKRLSGLEMAIAVLKQSKADSDIKFSMIAFAAVSILLVKRSYKRNKM